MRPHSSPRIHAIIDPETGPHGLNKSRKGVVEKAADSRIADLTRWMWARLKERIMITIFMSNDERGEFKTH